MVIFSKNVLSDYITTKHIFYFECHIILIEYLIASYLLLANKAAIVVDERAS